MCQRCVENTKANLLNAQAVSHLTDSYVRLYDAGARELAQQVANTISEMLPVEPKDQTEKSPDQTEEQQGLDDMPDDLRAVLAGIFGIDPSNVRVMNFRPK